MKRTLSLQEGDRNLNWSFAGGYRLYRNTLTGSLTDLADWSKRDDKKTTRG